jgi:CBS domain-containing protein
MAVVAINIQSQIMQLSSEALNAFSEDISGMFDVDMECTQKEVLEITVADLEKYFKTFTAINTISATGSLNGNFLLIFDQQGLFILAGIIDKLPDKKILENIKQTSEKKAANVVNAVKECGNLLVGSWNRIFRENLDEHGNFEQSNTFIGVPWKKSKKSIGLSKDQEILFISYEITIGSYPSFTCGVIFPKGIFGAESDLTKNDDKTQQKPVSKEKKHNEPEKIEKSLTVTDLNLTSKELTICAKDIMQKNVIWIEQDDTVEVAINKMKENDAGYLMVGSDGILEGIVSRSDIAGAVSPYLRTTFAKWRRPIDDATLQIRIKWIMSRPVRTIKLKTPITIMMENMSRYGGRCLPVVDQKGKVIGLVTVFEIFNTFLTGSGISVVGRAGQPPLFV